MSDWGEEQRVELSAHTAFNHAKQRMRELKGDDRMAVHREYQEWFLVSDADTDTDIFWCSDFRRW